MIQINLAPGAVKKTRSRGVSFDLGALTSGLGARISDPYLIIAVVGALIGLSAVGGMWLYQGRKAESLATELEAAAQDSIRFAAVIKERRKTESQRDSVLTQLALIRSLDGKRYIWPHLMDEVSRALPAYTWLTSITQQGDAAPAAAAPAPPAKAAKGDSAKAAKKTPKEYADSLESAARVQFRVVGNTVDIQALTRFMKLLEASPFIENVQLVKSAMILVDGKEVTEFQLDAAYQKPDSAAISTTPLTVSVR
ncbi:MAG TPA: PilN domain-containing protein [Gemmatimonadaceae bacterium]|nr:PilN domain-containing protein [Gemmatimonadaceae bacterium]